MRGPTPRPFDPVVSPVFINSIHEGLRGYDGERVGDPRPCPNCTSDQRRKNGYQNQPKTFVRIVTEDGLEDVGVRVQQFECTDCGRSYQGDLSGLFYPGCDYAKPVVDLCRFHARNHSFAACERVLRQRYGVQVSRDTIERYVEQFDDTGDWHPIEIAGYRYSLDFLSFLFGDADDGEPQFVISQSTAMW